MAMLINCYAIRLWCMQNGLQVKNSDCQNIKSAVARCHIATVICSNLPVAGQMYLVGIILEQWLTSQQHITVITVLQLSSVQAICHTGKLLVQQHMQVMARSLILLKINNFTAQKLQWLQNWTMQLRLCSKCQDDPTPSCCCAAASDCQRNTDHQHGDEDQACCNDSLLQLTLTDWLLRTQLACSHHAILTPQLHQSFTSTDQVKSGFLVLHQPLSVTHSLRHYSKVPH